MAECSISPFVDISNEDHTPTPNPLEKIPNHQSNTSNPPTPLGTFSTLPRELRDEIYRHLHDHRYELHSPECRKWRSVDTQSLPTMRLSKVIREEFLAILFAETVFSLSDWDVRVSREMRSRTETQERGEILYIDRIQNVSYRAQLSLQTYNYSWGTHVGDAHFGDADYQRRDDKTTLETSAEPISFLTGTEVVRNSCSIQISPITPKLTFLLRSPFMNAVKGLTGFKTVMLEVDSIRSVCLPDGHDATDHAIMIRAFMDGMRATLEGSLGPGVISEDCERRLDYVILGAECVDERIESRITFHPRDFASKEKNLKSSPSAQGDAGSKCSPQDGSS